MRNRGAVWAVFPVILAGLAGCGSSVTTATTTDAGTVRDVPAVDVRPVTDVPAPPVDVPPPPVDVPPPPVDATMDHLPFQSPCTADVQCASGICVQTPGLTPGCGMPCHHDPDCMALGGMFNCALDRGGAGGRMVCAEVNGAGSVGAQTCHTDTDCFSALCVSGICRNACSDNTECAAGWRCGAYAVGGATVQVCREDPISAVTVEDYTVYDTDTLTERTIDPVPIVVPPDAIGITWISQETGGNTELAGVMSVTDPMGTALIDSTSWSIVRDQPVRSLLVEQEIHAPFHPSTNVFPLHPGLYQATWGLFNPQGMPPLARAHLRAVVRIKRSPGALQVAPWYLHLRVHLVGLASGPTAATAAGNARLQAAIGNFQHYYSTPGVVVVVDGYVDAPAGDAPTYAVIDSQAELNSLLATETAGLTGDALDLFLVRGISASAGLEGAIGVSGAIAGAPGVHGTIHAGVVVGWESTNAGPGRDVLGETMAHECGHFLGLWHVIEHLPACTTPTQMNCSPWGGVDPISDTPTDPGNAARYLMNWSTDGTNTQVSPGEAYVLRVHGLVH